MTCSDMYPLERISPFETYISIFIVLIVLIVYIFDTIKFSYIFNNITKLINIPIRDCSVDNMQANIAVDTLIYTYSTVRIY